MSDNSEYAVLVVDDDEPIVKNMRRVLRRKGFNKMVTALNGEQGIKLLETAHTPFFLIISDQRMPGISGSEFLEKSILISPESRRMLITGYSNFEAITDAVNKSKIHQYISKPWNNDDLLLRIMGELEIYKNFQERKHLFNVTKQQNAKLFSIAATQRKGLKENKATLQNKKKELQALVQRIKYAKRQAGFKDVFLGLDALLSQTITINESNMIDAFKMSRSKADKIFQSIYERNNLSFTPGDIRLNEAISGELEEDTFNVIDQVIENMMIDVEPSLFDIGNETSSGVTIDDYKQVPGVDELAFNDGFITKGELERARQEMEKKAADNDAGHSIDKVLILNGFLRRQDLSRIFTKITMIETRLLDRELSRMIINREITCQKDVDRAFRKQLNSFQNSGVVMLLADILMEFKIITRQVRDEIMGAQDRDERVKGDINQGPLRPSEIDAFVDLQISKDQVQAWIKVSNTIQGTSDISPLKSLIKKRGINYGIVSDIELRNFLKNCTDPDKKFVVAQGILPSTGKPAEIVYHFKTQSEQAGVINENGSIDFTSRGESPFVKKDQLLAQKIPMEYPKFGVNVFGETILVKEIHDAPFEIGSGVKLSEDGLKITALINGQPSINSKGVVSVFESFTVNGDVDFKTGNINFNGNVIVTGTVREGFRVECEELTANEINGATIRTRGNLKVSNGIVNSDIQAEGSVLSKFLNRTELFGARDIMITREIMESNILIGGMLNNDTGRITASRVNARKGMTLKQVGTERAKRSTITIGTDDYINWITQKYESEIEKRQKELNLIIAQKEACDKEYNSLHMDIANQTFAQEKIIKKINVRESRIKKSKTKEEISKITHEISELESVSKNHDKRIKDLFKEQDIIQQKANEYEKKIAFLNEELKNICEEKDLTVSRIENEAPIPKLIVRKKLHAGTRVNGTLSNIILKQDLGASKFEEIETDDPHAPKQLIHQTLNF